jgi:hypothetical protein
MDHRVVTISFREIAQEFQAGSLAFFSKKGFAVP